jgi:N-acetylglucosamine kinase-like BadF-type ATPase
MKSDGEGPIKASEHLVLGIDGGQTSTRCILATSGGVVLGQGEGGALIHLAAAGGPEQFADALRQAVNGAWQSAGRSSQPIEAIGLGLTGVEADGEEAHIVADVVPTIVTAAHVEVQSDAVTALVGAHGGAPGIMAIAGTGSVILGQDRHGKMWRVGGWGWLLGDEGSALAIGHDGLVVALQAIDGAVEPTTMSSAFVDYFGVSRPRDIKNVVYAPDFGARGFGQLARIVSAEAERGDATARAIVGRHASALARDVLAATRQLDFAEGPIEVAAIGGAFEHVYGLRAGFESALASVNTRIHVHDPLLPPVLGAVLLAIRAAGALEPETVTRLGHFDAARRPG